MAFSRPPKLLIFTDLDGTLLDHNDYSWDAATPSLREAKEQGLPVIINSSKTLEECLDLQRRMELEGPLIHENGAGVAIPVSLSPAPAEAPHLGSFWLKSFAPDYAQVREVLCVLRAQHKFLFRGFGDMSLSEICELTGLAEGAAAKAKNRSHSEPLLWQDGGERLEEFTDLLRSHDLKVTRGGRFTQVTGPTDKGEAMRWLAELYGRPVPILVALGDSHNDLAMLRRADIAVQIPNPQGSGEELNRDGFSGRWLRAEKAGPAGWNESVRTIIREFSRG